MYSNIYPRDVRDAIESKSRTCFFCHSPSEWSPAIRILALGISCGTSIGAPFAPLGPQLAAQRPNRSAFLHSSDFFVIDHTPSILPKVRPKISQRADHCLGGGHFPSEKVPFFSKQKFSFDPWAQGTIMERGANTPGDGL